VILIARKRNRTNASKKSSGGAGRKQSFCKTLYRTDALATEKKKVRIKDHMKKRGLDKNDFMTEINNTTY